MRLSTASDAAPGLTMGGTVPMARTTPPTRRQRRTPSAPPASRSRGRSVPRRASPPAATTKPAGPPLPAYPPPPLLPSRLAGGLQSPGDCGRPARPSRRRGQPRVELAMHAPRGRPRARARSCEQGRERAHSERNGSSSPQLAPPSQRRAHRAHETGVARALDARHSCLRRHHCLIWPVQSEWQLRVLFQL